VQYDITSFSLRDRSAIFSVDYFGCFEFFRFQSFDYWNPSNRFKSGSSNGERTSSAIGHQTSDPTDDKAIGPSGIRSVSNTDGASGFWSVSDTNGASGIRSVDVDVASGIGTI
jgi:hypothetical protein